jgi:hypothetical protein
MGEWDRIDATLAGPRLRAASTSLVRRDLEVGMAIRRGDLAVAEEILPMYRADALASGEPQRVMPMLGVAFARAAVAGDAADLRSLTETLIELGPRVWVPTFASTTISRALAHGDADLLRRVDRALQALPPERRLWRVDVAAQLSAGLVALANGDGERAVSVLEGVARDERRLGRPFDAACIELELARALEAAGREPDAGATRAQARAQLDALGCVNPY